MTRDLEGPFLRAPRFGKAAPDISRIITNWAEVLIASSDPASAVAAAIFGARVGGCFWEVSHQLPYVAPRKHVVVSPPSTLRASNFLWRVLESVPAAETLLVLPSGKGLTALGRQATAAGVSVMQSSNPQDVVAHCQQVHLAAMGDIGVLALLAGLQVHHYTHDAQHTESPSRALAWLTAGTCYTDPFTGRPTSCEATIELLSDWRRTMFSNRDIGVCTGISLWKRGRIAQMLATGATPVAFRRTAGAVMRVATTGHGAIAAWSTRMPPRLEAMADACAIPIYRIEDGFIRSHGLGSGLLPPASIIIDGRGVYYDPSAPSDLECMLQGGTVDAHLRARAAALMTSVVRAGISKYAVGGPVPLPNAAPGQKILLVPGQVDDDMSLRLEQSPFIPARILRR